MRLPGRREYPKRLFNGWLMWESYDPWQEWASSMLGLQFMPGVGRVRI
jgi:hypothetical protein